MNDGPIAASKILTESDALAIESLDFSEVLARRSEHELFALRNQASRITHDDGDPTFLFLILKMYLESLLLDAREVLKQTVTVDNMGAHNRAMGQVEVISPLLDDGLGLVHQIDLELGRREEQKNRRQDHG